MPSQLFENMVNRAIVGDPCNVRFNTGFAAKCRCSAFTAVECTPDCNRHILNQVFL